VTCQNHFKKGKRERKNNGKDEPNQGSVEYIYGNVTIKSVQLLYTNKKVKINK
jgi:hypothetical protein